MQALMQVLWGADKKQKRKKGQAQAKAKPEDELSVVLYEDETQQQPVDPEVPNLQAWRPGRVLQIGDAKFSITYNPPTAEKVPPLQLQGFERLLHSTHNTAQKVMFPERLHGLHRCRHLGSR